jgi:hypothetical protein
MIARAAARDRGRIARRGADVQGDLAGLIEVRDVGAPASQPRGGGRTAAAEYTHGDHSSQRDCRSARSHLMHVRDLEQKSQLPSIETFSHIPQRAQLLIRPRRPRLASAQADLGRGSLLATEDPSCRVESREYSAPGSDSRAGIRAQERACARRGVALGRKCAPSRSQGLLILAMLERTSKTAG